MRGSDTVAHECRCAAQHESDVLGEDAARTRRGRGEALERCERVTQEGYLRFYGAPTRTSKCLIQVVPEPPITSLPNSTLPK